MSTAYYDKHAERYFRETVDTDLAAVRSRFVAYLPPGGRILDAGCGSGRDALAFRCDGYKVTAFDGSAAMARIASRHTGLDVRHLTFDQVEWHSEFDGVWACASLLHVERTQLSQTIARLASTLNAEGILFACFKRGDVDRSVDDRCFTDLTERDLIEIFGRAGLSVLETWASIDSAKRSAETWINAIGRKD